MAGHAVTAADPSGLWGQLKEKRSGRWTLLEAKTFGANELIRAVAPDFDANASRTAACGRGANEPVWQSSFGGPGQGSCFASGVAALGDSKAPDEAAAFKDWLKRSRRRRPKRQRRAAF